MTDKREECYDCDNEATDLVDTAWPHIKRHVCESHLGSTVDEFARRRRETDKRFGKSLRREAGDVLGKIPYATRCLGFDGECDQTTHQFILGVDWRSYPLCEGCLSHFRQYLKSTETCEEVSIANGGTISGRMSSKSPNTANRPKSLQSKDVFLVDHFDMSKFNIPELRPVVFLSIDEHMLRLLFEQARETGSRIISLLGDEMRSIVEDVGRVFLDGPGCTPAPHLDKASILVVLKKPSGGLNMTLLTSEE